MGCLRDTIPKLSRSALHRCLERHGISRLPQNEEATSKRKRFAETTIGYVVGREQRGSPRNSWGFQPAQVFAFARSLSGAGENLAKPRPC
jgi:hypothetical protein